jgi:hypothetical protein
MWKVDVDELTSAVEQISHSLEEHQYKVNHLAIPDKSLEMDPEDDPGSVSYIHKALVSMIPENLSGADLLSKLRAAREIATVVGLSNVGIAKPVPNKDDMPFSMLRRLHGLDADVTISEGSKSILETWGKRPEVERNRTTTSSKPARKRVKFEGEPNKLSIQPSSQTIQPSSQRIHPSSQRMVTPVKVADEEMISMSQPVRGKYGDSRRKLRKSGF